ncbi:transglycosylase domain-containing protein [Bacillus taeanensis]|uniref:Primosomal protein n=1 Tax=Bacillus taeanensis TaxID=273032 RepID=A0A366XU33_9BACI|nr:PBP1A family penicillin-binding protein [Bacillus taeanensis]RBW67481.1 primosomal protein [Bacillus taeanensis]
MTSKQSSQSENVRENDKKEKIKKLFRLSVGISFILFLVIVLAGAITIFAFIHDAPKFDPKLLHQKNSSIVYDQNGNGVGYLTEGINRQYVKIDDIPKSVQAAFINTEDERFYTHLGIDVKRIVGAVIANFKNGFGAEGASTITQQLVKNSFLSSEKSLKRKVQEVFLAMQIERSYSKQQILEMYLNTIYFGERAYGVGTAADVYFNKTLDELTVSEIALLAGLPQRPSGYNPYEYPEAAKERRNTVLRLMREHHHITKEEEQAARTVRIEEMLGDREREKGLYPAFMKRVVQELSEKGIEKSVIYNGSLKVYTSLNSDAQKYLEYMLSSESFIAGMDEKLRSGVILLNTKTGNIEAVANRNLENEGEGVNYAVNISRQPGSTIKPILDYGPGIEYNQWSTFKRFKDEPLEIDGKNIQNWDGQYHGEISMREALTWSYNIPAVKAYQEIGEEKAKEFAGNLGISLDDLFPSYAIGGFKHGVSPLQLAGAYAAFANNGIYHQPHAVQKIVFADGREVDFTAKSVQAMQDSTAYMVTDMLKDVVKQGTGQEANILGLPLAGKTGTTNLPAHIQGEGTSDAWFVGYTPRYTAAVWSGYDKTTEETYIHEEDDDVSKLIFKKLMIYMSQRENAPIEEFVQPHSVVELPVDRSTGRYTNSAASNARVAMELFVKGTEPEGTPVSKLQPEKEEKKEN